MPTSAQWASWYNGVLAALWAGFPFSLDTWILIHRPSAVRTNPAVWTVTIGWFSAFVETVRSGQNLGEIMKHNLWIVNTIKITCGQYMYRMPGFRDDFSFC